MVHCHPGSGCAYPSRITHNFCYKYIKIFKWNICYLSNMHLRQRNSYEYLYILKRFNSTFFSVDGKIARRWEEKNRDRNNNEWFRDFLFCFLFFFPVWNVRANRNCSFKREDTQLFCSAVSSSRYFSTVPLPKYITDSRYYLNSQEELFICSLQTTCGRH